MQPGDKLSKVLAVAGPEHTLKVDHGGAWMLIKLGAPVECRINAQDWITVEKILLAEDSRVYTPNDHYYMLSSVERVRKIHPEEVDLSGD